MRLRIVLVATLLLAACSGADEGVRTIGSESSASGSGSGSGSPSGTATDGSADSPSGVVSEPSTGSASGVSASGVGGEAAVGCAPPSAPSGSAITVTLTEWEVNVPPQVPDGIVTVTAGNIGGEPHELVIVAGGDPDALPVSEGRVVEDDLPDGAFIGEIESFGAGDTCAGTFELAPGDYVFFCNLTEEKPDGTIESHFEEGMRTVVTVG